MQVVRREKARNQQTAFSTKQTDGFYIHLFVLMVRDYLIIRFRKGRVASVE